MLEDDDVSLPEAELAGVLGLEVVERLTGWLAQLGGGGAGRVSVGRGHARVEPRAELGGVVGRRPSRRTGRRDETATRDVAETGESQHYGQYYVFPFPQVPPDLLKIFHLLFITLLD